MAIESRLSLRRVSGTTIFHCLLGGVIASASILLPGVAARAAAVDFEEQVLPILEESCLHCHGEDEQEAGLRLDRRAELLRGGDSGLAAVVPGDPGNSYLLTLVEHKEDGMEMPTDDDKLSQEKIDLLTRWVKEGAVWPGQMEEVVLEMEGADHWAFQAVVRPAVPAGAANPVDAFLNRKLQDEGLKPNGIADARSLVRRLSILLTGIAPTPERVERFVGDSSADAESAYSTLVDELLQSPHFGERWAQHWLDVIRWAETNGSEANLYRKNAWVYRDYVIRSLNEDKPYDQFLKEQLAGDTMGSGEALGFLVSGPHVPAATVGQEASAIRQARADRMDEIMQTVGASMMGMTVGCARCHNHKFDPLSISDYYSMTAVFQDIEFGSRFPELNEEHPRKQRGKELWTQIAAARNKLWGSGPWEEDWGAYWELRFPAVKAKAIRLKFKANYIGMDEWEVYGPEQTEENLALASRGTQVSGPDEMVADPRNVVTRLNDGEYGTMSWRAKAPKGSKEKPWAQYDFETPQTVSRLRLSSNREYFFDTDYLDKKPTINLGDYDVEILGEDGEWRTVASRGVIHNKLDKENPVRREAISELKRMIGLLAEEGPRPSFIGRFVQPKMTRVLHRGSPENPKSEVMPAAPLMLDGDLGLDSSTRGAKRRRLFAEWVVDPSNPLTSRVMVNRIWHHLFGTGIVSTTSDFGTAGAAPSHPELLDWLAAEFVQPESAGDEPWSVKSMVRLMVMSDAFRRSSRPAEAGLKVDAGSRLLWRFPPRRVEAEVIRDSILQASGLLDPQMGGRGYRIHNEKKTYAQWQVTDNHGEHTWRRMIYQERMRRVDDQMFTAFDFPDCGQVRAKRPVSTTPLQALNLMNSAFIMSQSKRIADRANGDSGGDLKRSINRCFQLLLDRDAGEQELAESLQVANEHGLALVCRALINSNEFSFLP